MHRSLAWLAAAALVVVGVSGDAHAQGLKPYVVLDLDTSGSMDDATNAGVTSCGTSDTRLNHARCAITKIANSYGDMVFALGRFRMNTSGTLGTNTCAADCNLLGADVTGGINCQDAGNDDDHFELLTGLVDGDNQDAATWTDATCNTCGSAIGSNPEIFEPSGNTPIGGSLLGARRYYQGLQATNGTVIWPSASPGFNPIANDPLKLAYVTGTGANPGDQQCRPYIVISLTDGAETCGGNPPAAATSLYDTIADGRHYRIETKAIGFGITPGDNAIENLAIAGKGGTGVAGTCNATDQTGCDGYYASNEQELSLAISAILASTIRSETCDGLNNDCDAFTDEDFPSLDDACDNGLLGVCRGTGIYVCTADHTGTVCQITDPGDAPGTEVCNNLDDNCNGLIDEGLSCGGCGDAETCDGEDEDCDGEIDEDLARPCGTDVGDCTAGTEVCEDGMWVGCTATGPFAEVCDGRDNDCDGVCDGFTQECSVLSGGNPDVGPCHPGQQQCPALCSATGNSFGACLNEVVPTTEVCNCVDDDCNGTPDNGTGGANCDSSCGVGTTVCDPTTCALRCDSTITPGPEVACNGLDDNCDGEIDEDYVSVPCDDGGTICNGHTVCVMGNEVCVGTTIGPEQCNCEDNDCDGNSDETGTCPGGSTCTACQCAFPCDGGEFSCPVGRACVDGFCLVDNCAGVNCAPDGSGNATICIPDDPPATGHTCEPACDHLTQPCPTGTVCYGPTGQCVFDDCRTFPERCTEDQVCQVQDNIGTCVSDPCFDVNCPSEQYCVAGSCFASCGDVVCPDGERCRMGACEPDPCGGPCPPAMVCSDAAGICVENPCNGQNCQGEVCDPQTGECIVDPCTGVTCPGNDICQLGTCYDPSAFQPDAAGPEQHVTTGGGGGCAASGTGDAGWIVLGVAFLLVRRRRRARAPATAEPEPPYECPGGSAVRPKRAGGGAS
jgi:hypothetical protein